MIPGSSSDDVVVHLEQTPDGRDELRQTLTVLAGERWLDLVDDLLHGDVEEVEEGVGIDAEPDGEHDQRHERDDLARAEVTQTRPWGSSRRRRGR